MFSLPDIPNPESAPQGSSEHMVLELSLYLWQRALLECHSRGCLPSQARDLFFGVSVLNELADSYKTASPKTPTAT